LPQNPDFIKFSDFLERSFPPLDISRLFVITGLWQLILVSSKRKKKEKEKKTFCFSHHIL